MQAEKTEEKGNEENKSRQRRSGKNRVSRFGPVNQAFARAHGILHNDTSHSNHGNTNNASANGVSETQHYQNNVASGHDLREMDFRNGADKVMEAVIRARQTGELHLSSLDLTAPLPDIIFNLRNGMFADLSLDANYCDEMKRPWECHGEESITCVDFSDNDLSGTLNLSGVRESGDEEFSDEERRCGGLDRRIGKFLGIQTLRAKRCKLTYTPPLDVICCLEHISILDLSGNDIRHPVPLSILPKTLKVLDLSFNEIPSLFDSEQRLNTCEGNASHVTLCPNLIRLVVSHNRLTELFPPSARGFPMLQSLQFDRNSVEVLPGLRSIMHDNQCLQTIEGQNNQLRSPITLETFSQLLMVDFDNNMLENIPTITSSVMRFSISGNKVVSLKGMYNDRQTGDESFRTDLVELRIRDNCVSQLDDFIVKSMVKLKILDVENNNLVDLPHILGYLPDLHKIITNGNAIRTIRVASIENTSELKKSLRRRGPPPLGSGFLPPEPDDSGIRLCTSSSSAPSGCDVGGALDALYLSNRGDSLDISDQGFENLPNWLTHELEKASSRQGLRCSVGMAIKEVRLRKNRLPTLEGEWLSLMKNLRSLDAGQNKLRELPTELNNICLESLILDNNSLSSDAIAETFLYGPSQEVPSTLACTLTYLNLSLNNLTRVPSALFKLCNIRTIILSYNKIEDLSMECDAGGWRTGWSSLEYLDLSNNKLHSLGYMPMVLTRICLNMNTLLLNNNELESIPPELGLMKSLRKVDLRGNPQKAIRPAVLERSCEDVLSFLRGRINPLTVQEASSAATGKDIKQQVSSKLDCEPATPSSDCVCKNATDSNPKFVEALNNGRPVQGKLGSSSDSEIEILRRRVEDIEVQLEDTSLSTIKRYALKKSLALERSKVIRLQRDKTQVCSA